MSQTTTILRQLLIIRRVRSLNKNHIYPSIETLVEYLKVEFEKRDISNAGISIPTLKRDIEQIRSFFRIDFNYITKERGYCIEEEQDASFVESSLESFEIIAAVGADGLMPNHIIPEKRKLARGLEHFSFLSRCIEKKMVIEFSYYKYDSDTTTQPIVKPLFLKESKGRWYLLAMPENETEIKAYGLDRMQWVDTTDKCFKLNISKEEIEAKYNDCFAMFTSDKPAEKVVLSFDLRDGNYLTSYPMHHSQTVEVKEKEVIITLQIKITLDFMMELMSRAWSVKVIEPLSLKNELHQYFSAAKERNL
ncbi:MAG: WYL domain-containing protein [Flavobacteriales bacterium]|nr:WYL domain-containing protein [Flavobacteriales bacterium]